MKANSLAGILLVLAGLTWGCQNSPPPPVWLANLPAQVVVSPDTAQQLVQAAADHWSDPEAQRPWPAALAQDHTDRVLFLTVPGSTGSAQVATGSGHGWTQALQAALGRFAGQPSPAWLKLDLVCVADSFSGKVHLGLDGVGFAELFGVLPEELTHRPLLKKRRLRDDFVSRLPLHIPPPQVSGRPSYRITTRAVLWTPQGCTPLYRGHRLYTIDQLTPERLRDAARRAGDFLLRQLDTQGRFAYAYRPPDDRNSKDYNLLRHAGCCYALVQLSQSSAEARYREAAQRALQYLVTFLKADEAGNLSLVEGGQVKLGGNALAIVALLEYQRASHDDGWNHLALGLGRSLLAAQSKDGRFAVHKRDFASGESSEFTSGYYPGEAILALTYLHRLQPQGPWLAAAARAADYLIEVRDKRVPDLKLPHDHWLLLGLSQLQELRPQARYPRHMRAICRAIRAAQRKHSQEPDWDGGFYSPPRLGPTAIRCEGLAAALRWLPAAEAQETRLCLQRGVVFQMQAQLDPESCAYFPDPARSLGGIPRSLTQYELRIDSSQHFISAVLAAASQWRPSPPGESPDRSKQSVSPPRSNNRAGVFPAQIPTGSGPGPGRSL